MGIPHSSHMTTSLISRSHLGPSSRYLPSDIAMAETPDLVTRLAAAALVMIRAASSPQL